MLEKVQYGGKYQITEGFGKATCSSEMEAADEVAAVGAPTKG